MKPKIFHSLRVTSVVATALLAAACASNDTSDPLAQATQTFKMANSSQAVRQHAPAELNLARNALSSARTAVKEKADGDEIVHRAYVAEQRAKIALNRGNARASQKQIVQLGERREQLMLAAQSQKALTAQQRLQAQLSELSTKHNARGLVVTLGDILFDSNGTTLKPGGHKQIGRLAEVLQTAPDRKVIVEGHTDSLGTDEYNLNLSQQRADVVRQELIAKGVDKARVGSTGLGESTPVATNETSAGRQQNRRVEIIIENPKQAAR